MTDARFGELIATINERLQDYAIGHLQETRKRLIPLKRIPSRHVFRKTGERYVFHVGGRVELQFNIALEHRSGRDELRHGVAFSFQRSRSLTDIRKVKPWIEGFNLFLVRHENIYADLRMWYWQPPGDVPSEDYAVGPIPTDWQKEGNFVFIGKRQPVVDKQPDVDLVCDDLDRLFRVYRFAAQAVGRTTEPEEAPVGVRGFRFTPRLMERRATTTRSHSEGVGDVELLHNRLQQHLCEGLVAEHGADNVGMENISSAGGRIDAVVKHGDGYTFYEIKTGKSPRACLREAIGQLLEYAFWGEPPRPDVKRLIVVGEARLDEDGANYLALLRKRFKLPIEYKATRLK